MLTLSFHLQIRLSSVDAYTSSSDGVWHPDTISLRMGWEGSGIDGGVDGPLAGGLFNPFAAVPDSLVVEAFTEQLPQQDGAQALQWAMPQQGSGDASAADRGNLAIACQDLRPGWLSKPGYLAFGALRAYPLTQMRQLCTALHERSLPLGHAAVQTLIRQVGGWVGK